MVPYANTVVDPGAVMVEPFYAVVTYGAVAGAGCADNLAVWA